MGIFPGLRLLEVDPAAVGAAVLGLHLPDQQVSGTRRRYKLAPGTAIRSPKFVMIKFFFFFFKSVSPILDAAWCLNSVANFHSVTARLNFKLL